jgi:hypothetical protein
MAYSEPLVPEHRTPVTPPRQLSGQRVSTVTTVPYPLPEVMCDALGRPLPLQGGPPAPYSVPFTSSERSRQA